MVLNLPYPPSVNSYWRHPNKGKLAGRHLISAEGRSYRRDVWVACRQQHPSVCLVGPVKMTIALTAPDKRRRDLDNTLKALLDALTHAKVIEDDSMIKELHMSWLGVAKPGCADVIVERLT